MSFFIYEARSRSGEFFEGCVEARNKREAAGLIRRRGLWIASLRQKETEAENFSYGQQEPRTEKVRLLSSFGRTFLHRRLDSRLRIVFVRQLAVMLQTGLPIHQALQMLLQSGGDSAYRRSLQALLSGIMAGRPFHEMLRQHPELFPAALCGFVEAGEKSGSLAAIFAKLAVFEEHRYEAREALKSSLLYPIALFAASILAIVLMAVFVMPTFAGLLQDMQVELPWPTRFLLFAMDFFTKHGLLLLMLLTAALCSLLVLWQQPKCRLFLDRWFLRLPFFGALQQYALWRLLFELLGTMLQNGLPLLSALHMAEKVPANLALRENLRQICRQVESGKSFSLSLQQQKCCPAILTELLTAGEAAGTLALMMGRAAAFADTAVRQRSARLGALAEPLLILLVGGLVFFFVLSVMLPLLTTMDALM
ncbi:MAG: type II secretion system F family protein [Mitsuokella sp.]|uniref:type II secretion system F family protein n=1 Tax=Mitsuokella sp. TaxID=2049034 RepID=UPI003F0FD22C